MKNWLPFVFGPALAIESRNGLVCFSWNYRRSEGGQERRLAFSSANSTIDQRRDDAKRRALSVNRLPASSISPSEVSALEHCAREILNRRARKRTELRDHAVERAALVAEAVLAGAELAEVAGGLGDDIVEESSGSARATTLLRT